MSLHGLIVKMKTRSELKGYAYRLNGRSLQHKKKKKKKKKNAFPVYKFFLKFPTFKGYNLCPWGLSCV